MTSFAVYFNVQLGIGKHSAAKGLKLGETWVIWWIVVVLRKLVQPNMKSLAEGATVLLSHIFPNTKAWPSGGAGDFDLTPFQVIIFINMTQFLVPELF